VKGKDIYPRRPELADKNFWRCVPCNAHVGCHQKNIKLRFRGDEPLGRLADANLRLAKKSAHAAFDPLWASGRISRTDAYAWLATRLGITPEKCHIGDFDISMCRAVEHAVAEHLAKQNPAYSQPINTTRMVVPRPSGKIVFLLRTCSRSYGIIRDANKNLPQ
jgi:hypothetical protein